MCEHEHEWDDKYTESQCLICKTCKLCYCSASAMDLATKLASAEKALADANKEKEKVQDIALRLIARADQAESQAAAMREALTEIAHVHPTLLTDVTDMREMARAALASYPSAGREALKEEI